MSFTVQARRLRTLTRGAALLKLGRLSPMAAALAYPHLLTAFYVSRSASQFDPASEGSVLIASMALVAALCVPLFGLAVAARLGRIEQPSQFEIRARRLAFLSIATPPLYVLFGVGLGLVGSPVSDLTVWNLCWIGALLFGALGSERPYPYQSATPTTLRFLHGYVAALLSCFVLFHLGNHLAGWLGPDVHARIMDIGRFVYRADAVEPILVGMFLLQVLMGAVLAWSWSRSGGALHRTIQIGSGIYVGAFILTHLNSALVSARAIKGIATDWAWASGAPVGLLDDAWNIRLVPHYAFGVFFVLVHLCSGLRVVLTAHGVDSRRVEWFWIMGVTVSGVLALAIVAALCGLRL